jgi:hypothetical protein
VLTVNLQGQGRGTRSGEEKGKRLGTMLEIIVSDEFKKIVEGIGGYDASQTGNTTFWG